MDSVEVNLNEEDSGEHLFSPKASDYLMFSGNPEVRPRVGDKYEVETSSPSGCLLLFLL